MLFITLFALILPGIVITIIILAISPDVSPVAYTILVFNTGTIFLLIISDPIVIMRNADMKEVLAKIKAAAVQKWKPKEFTATVIENIATVATSDL